MDDIVKTFSESGDFEASHAAERWCAENGISVGRCQGPSPRGLLYGDYDIQKWRNLNVHERAMLDGTLTGDMRHGPVHLRIKTREFA